jgi:hypothetical protein
MEQDRAGEGFTLVAEIPIEEVRTAAATVVLQGHGTDRQEYRLELHFDIPVDPQGPGRVDVAGRRAALPSNRRHRTGRASLMTWAVTAVTAVRPGRL